MCCMGLVCFALRGVEPLSFERMVSGSSTKLRASTVLFVGEMRGRNKWCAAAHQYAQYVCSTRLVSMPYLDDGGICADDAVTKRSSLTKRCAFDKHQKADYLDLRHRCPAASIYRSLAKRL